MVASMSHDRPSSSPPWPISHRSRQASEPEPEDTRKPLLRMAIGKMMDAMPALYVPNILNLIHSRPTITVGTGHLFSR